MADEVTDWSNKEQFIIRFRLVDKGFNTPFFWACFKFGCQRYGEECTVSDGHNIRYFQSY